MSEKLGTPKKANACKSGTIFSLFFWSRGSMVKYHISKPRYGWWVWCARRTCIATQKLQPFIFHTVLTALTQNEITARCHCSGLLIHRFEGMHTESEQNCVLLVLLKIVLVEGGAPNSQSTRVLNPHQEKLQSSWLLTVVIQLWSKHVASAHRARNWGSVWSQIGITQFMKVRVQAAHSVKTELPMVPFPANEKCSLLSQ